MFRVLLLGILGFVVVVDAVGCATAATTQSSRDTRRLRALERTFHGFVAVKLHDLEEVEDATARLEQLRLDYLDALTEPSSDERDRLLAMLRLAELHLDLSARIRRVPYPSTDLAARAAFDATLSQHALPLEATGKGILEQIVQRADRAGVDGRFVARARLYAHLHPQQGTVALDDADVGVLQQELMASTFRAPRSLLEAGRLGQRAARR
ncbi:MAG: hypothetical protein Q8O67_09755 [Deltaproteobacteria bacterium]|nr:hypothetical protein [Deltaproteobacteria bacterium]